MKKGDARPENPEADAAALRFVTQHMEMARQRNRQVAEMVAQAKAAEAEEKRRRALVTKP